MSLVWMPFSTPLMRGSIRELSIQVRGISCISTSSDDFTARSNSASIQREVEDSLRRLSADVIDLYQIHWPPDPDSSELEEGWSMLARLQRQGKAVQAGSRWSQRLFFAGFRSADRQLWPFAW
jgi:aryl-alcohol dehydrogenase-like predicted oxidoreductase